MLIWDGDQLIGERGNRSRWKTTQSLSFVLEIQNCIVETVHMNGECTFAWGGGCEIIEDWVEIHLDTRMRLPPGQGKAGEERATIMREPPYISLLDQQCAVPMSAENMNII